MLVESLRIISMVATITKGYHPGDEAPIGIDTADIVPVGTRTLQFLNMPSNAAGSMWSTQETYGESSHDNAGER